MKLSPTLISEKNVEGECDYDTKTLTIDSTLTPAKQWYNFKHELWHALMDELHLTESDGLTRFQQEVVVEGFNQFLDKTFEMTLKHGRKK